MFARGETIVARLGAAYVVWALAGCVDDNVASLDVVQAAEECSLCDERSARFFVWPKASETPSNLDAIEFISAMPTWPSSLAEQPFGDRVDAGTGFVRKCHFAKFVYRKTPGKIAIGNGTLHAGLAMAAGFGIDPGEALFNLQYRGIYAGNISVLRSDVLDFEVMSQTSRDTRADVASSLGRFIRTSFGPTFHVLIRIGANMFHCAPRSEASQASSAAGLAGR